MITEQVILAVLLSLLLATAALTAASKNLFAAVLLFCVYSLLSASVFIVLDAPDVAFTEAAVGAGLSTVLFLMAIALTTSLHSYKPGRRSVAVLLAALVACALLYAVPDFPRFASQQTPSHQHVAEYYLRNTGQQVGVPNVVTAVLASYRGFDTFGELLVIFTAGVGVCGVFSIGLRRKRKRQPGISGSAR